MYQQSKQRLKILVVDDEPANRDLLGRALERDGHICIMAASGEEGLAFFTETQPDLVFMDVMMPGIDGFEATRRIRQHQTDQWVPVIFLSALNTPVDIVTGLDAGGDDYLTKPIDLSVLRSKVQTSQRLAELHRQLKNKTQQLQRYFDESEAEKYIAAELMRHLRREGRPPIPGVESRTIPAIDFAGDIIAIEEAPDGRLHLMLADAAGHGLVAAMNVLPAVETFYEMVRRGYELPRTIARINEVLLELIPGHRFVSALFAQLDAALGTIEVWNAGIPNAFLVDTDGRVLSTFGPKLLPLGIETQDYRQSQTESMAPGQMLVTTSDGLTEAANAAGLAFGEESLVAALAEATQGGCESILARLRAHSGSSVFIDDVSVCLVRQPSPPQLSGRFRHVKPTGACSAGDIGFSMSYDGTQLRRIGDIVPRFMALAKSQFDLPPSGYSRLFRVMRQLVANAIDWGLLRLPAGITQQPPAVRQQAHAAALAAMTEGRLHLSIHECQMQQGSRTWEVVVEDSGPGFDGKAALERAAASMPRPGGLALVADESIAMEFGGPGNRVSVWVPE